MCNHYWYSTVTMVARTRLNFTFVRNNRACKVEQKSRNARIQQKRKKLGFYIRPLRGFPRVTLSLLGIRNFHNTVKNKYCILPQCTSRYNFRWPPGPTLPVITSQDISHSRISQRFAIRADAVINTSCHLILPSCQMKGPVKITSIFTPTEGKLAATKRSNSVMSDTQFDTC
jgi:hypothetical protein